MGARTFDDDLSRLLRRLGYTPDAQAVAEIAGDADVGRRFDLPSLWRFLCLYRTREGLTHSELEGLEMTFKHYDRDATGDIRTIDCAKIFWWFGYEVSFTELHKLVALVDVGRTGK